ncbi:MAG: DegT/DnrJ/EryC1/StrS family aminotransferase, partial [Terrimicrobiaceae bacterium]|nr:DegT/DnrJ/EryC1/StrS family aminotransferase [Terrimicrobiaceae bacterium]
MPVPFFDLTRQHASCGGRVRERVEAVFASQQFILGEEVARFEREFAEVLGCGHAVGMSSGTDAELAVLMALGLGRGDAVLTTPFTFFATAGCLARLGIEPVFADIESSGFHLDAHAARGVILEDCRQDEQGLWRTRSGSVLRAVMP